ncbi:MAG: hypothetical protein ACPIOQ_17645 [Promethearchaeia archaeon]
MRTSRLQSSARQGIDGKFHALNFLFLYAIIQVMLRSDHARRGGEEEVGGSRT